MPKNNVKNRKSNESSSKKASTDVEPPSIESPLALRLSFANKALRESLKKLSSSELFTDDDDDDDVSENSDDDLTVNSGDSDDDSTNSEEFIGILSGTVVGLRYYDGLVSKGEMVLLNREPTNKHDKNAIRVDNTFGAQIGHIKKELAASLAPIMDSKLARIDGRVPCNKNITTMPINLSLFAKTNNISAVEAILGSCGQSLSKSNKCSKRKGTGASADDMPDFDESLDNMSATNILSERQMQTELETMFERMRDTDKTEEREPAHKRALAWMYKRENDESILPPFWKKENRLYINGLTKRATREKPEPICGGVLADDMGLGKTLQMISLIVSSFRCGAPMPLISTVDVSAANIKKSFNKRDSVLSGTKRVDSPLALLNNNEATGPSTSSNTSFLPSCIPKYREPEVVESPLTTSTNSKRRRIAIDEDENEESASFAASDQNDEDYLKKESNYVVELSDDDDDLIPLLNTTTPEKPVRFTEEQLDRLNKGTEEHSPRATLIVCPVSVMNQWEDQFREHLHGNVFINICHYYGSKKKNTKLNELKSKDIVLTTYATLTAASKRPKDLLFQIEWFRVVLDEAHVIRNPASQQSKACCALRAKRRWVLTGTPIQNRLRDLWSLIRFLRVEPFEDRGIWKVLIESQVKARNAEGFNRIRCLMQHLAMRRLKTDVVDGKPLVELPARNFFPMILEFNEDERKMYEAMHKEGKVIVNRYIREGTLLHHYAHVLVILLRLRQLCCHPFLVKKAAERAKELGIAYTLDEQGAIANVTTTINEEDSSKLIEMLREILKTGSEEECSICIEALKNPVITPCAHIFCRVCITKVVTNAIKNLKETCPCPMCRKELKLDSLLSIPNENVVEEKTEKMPADDWHSSAKVDALMKHLLIIRDEDPTVKSLVVSQFTSFLDLIEVPLIRDGFRITRLDGTMRQNDRADAVRSFSANKPNSPTVFLLSMAAGGVGINLVAATRVFLMDLAWNPAVEEQCFDRCHRLGQTKPVTIFKFIIKDSVEERMIELQESKRRLLTESFDNGADATPKVDNRQQRIRDIQLLMR